MNLFSVIRQKLIERKFKRQKLAIIQFIPVTQCTNIIAQCLENGWEKGRIYVGTDSWRHDGNITLSKGFSTLTFSRDISGNGQVSGPEMAIHGLADQYQLTASAKPVWPVN
ncbi:hypothetical protein [Neptunicella sp.]|uniref:hypothetical protein n=1 Tax=Neptunicella sp. TaxID=2125986 RepID=UPI003F693960